MRHMRKHELDATLATDVNVETVTPNILNPGTTATQTTGLMHIAGPVKYL